MSISRSPVRFLSSRFISVQVIVLLALAALLVACGAGGNGGNGGNNGRPQGLSIAAPVDGQVLAGTVAVAATGVGSSASSVVFRLGTQTASANSDGIAFLDSRNVSDGEYDLTATAQVGGRSVSDSITVSVNNDLPSSGTVGPQGGALKSAGGSIASVPPGAFGSGVQLTLEDTTEAQIFSRFGIDYSALGVTFLGSLTVDGDDESPQLPLQVDLAGWAEAVQPNQKVVMFFTAPDANGDGVGELMFAADAMATPGGSIVTTPIPRSEVDGFGEFGTLGREGFSALQSSTGAKPGQIVTVVGRGFNPAGRLSNVARFGSNTEVLTWVNSVDEAAFNPTMEVSFAVPALSSGDRSVTLHNLTTGFAAEPATLTVGALGSASTASWTDFVDQLRLTAQYATSDDTGLATMADAWLAALEAGSTSTAAALVKNSGLVSASNRNLLEDLGSNASGSEIGLMLRHALVLDAVAASVEELANPAANLATLLSVTLPHASGGSGGLSVAQAGGSSCSGSASAPTGGWVIGNPTGMGAAPPGACLSGSGAGGGGGPTSLRASDYGSASGNTLFDPATTSLRPGSFRPIAGAFVRVLRPGGGSLTPFTALTDATGYFTLPFVPPGEPFEVVAVDPATGNTASYEGVAGAPNERETVQLAFTGAQPGGPGAPVASFEIVPDARGSLEGTWWYEFDASGSSDPDGEISEYLWSFGGGLAATFDWTSSVWRGYGRNGTYDISLVVVDDDGNMSQTSRQLVIDDLPYDYWGTPPERVNTSAEGVLSNQEAWYGYAISEDGRYIPFSTEASNLGPVDENGELDLYLKDMQSGAVELLSSAEPGNSVSSDVAMSGDARYVAFAETNPNQIVVLDRQSGTRQIIVNDAGFQRHSVGALSSDGSFLAFEASTLNNSERPTWVVDLETDERVRLGLRTDGTTYANVDVLALSGDGRYVAFWSYDDGLVEGDSNGVADVFVTDLSTEETVRASENAAGVGGDAETRAFGRAISEDGRYVVFWSAATNFGGSTDGLDQIYLKDLQTGEIEVISTNVLGEPGDSDSVLPWMSSDTRYVAFGSYASNLVPEMDDWDICSFGCPGGFSYVKDRVTGRVSLVTMGMNDATPDDWDQIEPMISGSGEFVSFYSWATNLAPGSDDTGSRSDYYRARNPLWE